MKWFFSTTLFFLIFVTSLFAEQKKLEYYTVLTTGGLIEYHHSYLSSDKKFLVLIVWQKRIKDMGIRAQTILIYDIEKKRILQKLDNTFLKKYFYIEKGGIEWDSNNNLYLAFNFENRKSEIYVYNLKQKKLKQLNVNYILPKLISISPNDIYLLIAGTEETKKYNLNLYLFNLQNKKLLQIDKNIAYLKPIWLNDSKFVYEKNNNLFLVDILNNTTTQITHFKEGVIVEINTNEKNLFFIRQLPDEKQFISELEDWINASLSKKQPMYLKEYWKIDLATFDMKKINIFKTMRDGFIYNKLTIITPLPDNGKYHLWLVKGDKPPKQLTFGNYIDDLPLLYSKRILFFRRNYHTLMAINMENF